MPYIRSEDRNRVKRTRRTPGELNFAITLLVQDYFVTNGANYQAINDVLGALEGAKLEFYRRLAAPYENAKIVENGDVYKPPYGTAP